MRHAKSTVVLLSLCLLTACTEPDGSPGRGIEHGGALNKKNVGTIVGTIGGAVIGAQFGSGAGAWAAGIGGGLLGGLLGDKIGGSLDNADKANYHYITQQSMEKGQPGTWHNSKSGNSGTITPQKSYTNNSGQTCREYTQTITVGGKSTKGHGTACRESDGSWKIVQ